MRKFRPLQEPIRLQDLLNSACSRAEKNICTYFTKSKSNFKVQIFWYWYALAVGQGTQMTTVAGWVFAASGHGITWSLFTYTWVKVQFVPEAILVLVCMTVTLALKAPVKLGMGTWEVKSKHFLSLIGAQFFSENGRYITTWLPPTQTSAKVGSVFDWFIQVTSTKSGRNLLCTKPVKRFSLEQCSLEQLDGRAETA